jgi:hypothetical protein
MERSRRCWAGGNRQSTLIRPKLPSISPELPESPPGFGPGNRGSTSFRR